ncbi:hypothetical protein ABZ914_41955, partial [Spirillospora sp. NPDC046719]
MQQRAIDTALTALTGTALAGMLVAGVAVESAHGAPADKPMAHKATSQQVTGHHSNTTGHTTGKSKAKAAPKTRAVLSGSTTASYFWDDG